MTSKEILEILKKHYIKAVNKTIVPFSEFEEGLFNDIERDLEVLEIIKNHSDIYLSAVQNNLLLIATSGLNCACIDLSQKELKLIKEWLEND